MEQSSSRPSPLDMPPRRPVEESRRERESLAWIKERADVAVTLGIEGRPHGCLTNSVLLAAGFNGRGVSRWGCLEFLRLIDQDPRLATISDGMRVDVAKHDASTMAEEDFRRINNDFIEELAKEVNEARMIRPMIRDRGLVLSRSEKEHLRNVVRRRRKAGARVGKLTALLSEGGNQAGTDSKVS